MRQETNYQITIITEHGVHGNCFGIFGSCAVEAFENAIDMGYVNENHNGHIAFVKECRAGSQVFDFRINIQ